MDEKKNIKKNTELCEINDDEYDSELEEYKIYEYYHDTINLIQTSCINYVQKVSLPICEYLTCNSIDNFLKKYKKYKKYK
jgi:hypothetical protein